MRKKTMTGMRSFVCFVMCECPPCDRVFQFLIGKTAVVVTVHFGKRIHKVKIFLNFIGKIEPFAYNHNYNNRDYILRGAFNVYWQTR